MNKFFHILLLICVIGGAMLPFAGHNIAQAANGILRGSLDDTAKSALLKTGDAAPITATAAAGKIIGIALTYLGILFLILAVYAGITWMTAGGKTESTKKAKDILIAATIGFAVCLMAYQLTSYIITNIVIQ
ncbi:MAG: hypothetical protein V1928_05620 [Parcubacteria group bacterium]